jgi:hypothetical protein
MNHAIRCFLMILAAALVSAIIGGLFAAAVATLSPEFVAGLFGPHASNLTRYAAAVGAIWGIFLGAGAMAFALAVAAAGNRFRTRPRSDQNTDKDG